MSAARKWLGRKPVECVQPAAAVADAACCEAADETSSAYGSAPFRSRLRSQQRQPAAALHGDCTAGP